jgi:Tol biopolymer transport system component
VQVSTSGTDVDPNGYSVYVLAIGDEWVPQAEAIAVDDVASFDGLDARSLMVELTGLTYNCRVHGDNPLHVDVSRDEMSLAFDVTCRDTATAPSLNDRIVFLSDRGGKGDLYSMNPDGTDVSLIADTFEGDHSPDVAPDCKKIVMHMHAPFFERNLHVLSADGSNLVRLSEWFGAVKPAWSPDGNQIAFTCYGSGDVRNVCVMDAAGGPRTQLTNSQSINGYDEPSWSHDGNHIVFTSYLGRFSDIWVMDSSGGGMHNLTNSDFYDRSPRWSPDGTTIVFTSNRDDFSGEVDVWAMDADGSNPRNLTRGEGGYGPTWSPDGQYILFGSRRAEESYPEGDVWIMEADGSNPRNLTPGPGSDAAASWCRSTSARVGQTSTARSWSSSTIHKR